jgi:hypothetical protein
MSLGGLPTAPVAKDGLSRAEFGAIENDQTTAMGDRAGEPVAGGHRLG